jgi:superfamily II DNA or RNA helicase
MPLHKTEVRLNGWVHPNTKKFPLWITKTFKNYENDVVELRGCDVKKERLDLFPHQRFVRDYMQHQSPYRGLLLYHGLGVGKSCASIAIAEIMTNHREVTVMLPASLENNYMNELMRCGSDSYALDQNWKFVSVTKSSIVTADTMNIDKKLVKQFKGYWVVDEKGSKPNFTKLKTNEQEQIKLQMKDTIGQKYNFIHYNGLTIKKFNEMNGKGNIFDNKLIIVDEAHLFISKVVNNSTLANNMYNKLKTAVNVKIVLLSGTPIINYPHEIAYTLNLLHGFTYVYKIYYNGTFTQSDVLQQSEDILYHVLQKKNKIQWIEVVLTPFGFNKHKNGMLSLSASDADTDDTRIREIIKELQKSRLNVVKKSSDKMFTTEKVDLFPTDKDEFNRFFIDTSNKTTLNDDMFMRRLSGIVSYYESGDQSLYPTNLGVKHEEISFSEHQLSKYVKVRSSEIKKEQKQNKHNLFEQTGVFKTFSRLLCNFAFPDEIERPFPQKPMLMLNELDLEEQDVNILLEEDTKPSISMKKTYENRIAAALKSLRQQKHDYLSEENLHKYSPKYARVLQHVLDPAFNGSALIYSQFRTLEGLGILGIAFQARGYAEMKIDIDKRTNKVIIDVAEGDYMKPKYAMFTSDKDKSDLILKIFNSEISGLSTDLQEQLKKMDTLKTNEGNLRGSLIKVLMITQSGSTGISLKNVRQVHILEPYWNKAQINQVIGRAHRTCSHIALPESERNFKVFMYRMKFAQDQQAKILHKDRNKTTDQFIYELAENKDKIVSRLLDNVKRGSIDCALNKATNKAIKCFAFPLDVAEFERAYLTRIQDDHDNVIDQQGKKTIKVKPMKVTIHQVEYIWTPDTTELFDMELYRTHAVLDKLGTLESKNNGWYKLVLFKYNNNV